MKTIETSVTRLSFNFSGKSSKPIFIPCEMNVYYRVYIQPQVKKFLLFDVRWMMNGRQRSTMSYRIFCFFLFTRLLSRYVKSIDPKTCVHNFSTYNIVQFVNFLLLSELNFKMYCFIWVQFFFQTLLHTLQNKKHIFCYTINYTLLL